MSRIQHWTTPNVEPNIEIRDYFAVSGTDESMYPIGVLLYRTNNPAILPSKYIVRPVQRLQLNQYYCPICNCPTSQNIRLSC